MTTIEDILKDARKYSSVQIFDDIMDANPILTKIVTHPEYNEVKHKKVVLEVESIYLKGIEEYVTNFYADQCLLIGLYIKKVTVLEALNECKKYNVDPMCIAKVPRNSIVYKILTDIEFVGLLNYCQLIKDIMN